jgi:hypothetical protein
MKAAYFVEGIGFVVIIGAGIYLAATRTHPTIPQDEGNAASSTITNPHTDTMQEHDNMKVRSPAFVHEETIPSKYTCDSENISPPLAIDGAPTSTVSLVLIMDDPDIPAAAAERIGQPVFDHWVVFNMPGATTRLGEGDTPPGIEGNNSSGKAGYTGPCPPDREHRYLFKVYALDTMLDLQAGATKAQVEAAMQGHVLESTTLMGRYDRMRE